MLKLKLNKLLTLCTAIIFGATVNAQTASVQVIHNSADAIASMVDVYANGDILLDDFTFRTATPFVALPAGVDIVLDIAPATSSSAAESIYSATVQFIDGETYIVVADGIVSPTGYIPAQPFGLQVYDMGRETASTATNTDVLVHHGSTDAPTVDVVEVGIGAGTIVDDASYTNFAGYLELGTADYALAITDMTGGTTVATYAAPLASLGLDGAAITVVASGFLDPTLNSDGAAFGLYVALADGGDLIALPAAVPNDNPCNAINLPVDGTVGTYSNAFATVNAGEDAITPLAGTDGPSTCASQDGWCGGDAVIQNSIWFSFVAGDTGVNITTCNEGNDVDTQLALYSATDCTDYSTLTLLGANDDLVDACTNGTSDFASSLTYCGLTVGQTYWILVDSYQAEQGDIAISVTNEACPEFARLQVIHNSADAAAALVDIYANDGLLIDDFAFRTASPFIDVPAGVEIVIGVAPATSTSAADAIATFPVTLAADETYVVVADGIVSATGYSPAEPFGLQIYGMGREAASIATNTDVLVHHGATDAPTVDVVEVGVGAGTIVDNASYTDFAGYLELGTADYELAITDETGAVTVATYGAPLSALGLDGSAIVVVASGFLNPGNNSDGPGFGLWVALPSGGELIPLPIATGLEELTTVNSSIYPNPVTDELNLLFEQNFTGTIQIMSLDGRVIKSEFINNINARLDVSELASGTYFLIATNDTQKSVQKIIKN
ncbi:MAG: hypothetical protein ACI8XB_000666 [Patiriisocius sp.]|jgi:hypothetical protein